MNIEDIYCLCTTHLRFETFHGLLFNNEERRNETASQVDNVPIVRDRDYFYGPYTSIYVEITSADRSLQFSKINDFASFQLASDIPLSRSASLFFDLLANENLTGRITAIFTLNSSVTPQPMTSNE